MAYDYRFRRSRYHNPAGEVVADYTLEMSLIE